MASKPDIPVILLPDGRSVPEEAVSERAVPAGGPGGQHANRASTKVELRISTNSLPLSQEEHARLVRNLGSRLTDGGVLVLTADDERSQLRNRIIVRRRAGKLLAKALEKPRPRKKTQPSRGARMRARNRSMRHSKKKQSRRWKPGGEDV